MKFQAILSKKRPIVICCSAGVDSVAAAHFLAKSPIFAGVPKTIFYFNHQLRHQNNLMEEAVCRLAEDLGLEFVIGRAEWEKGEKRDENTFRKKRLSFITETFKGSQVVLAHHLDDCVESYLMNCLNGKERHLPIPIVTASKKSNNVLIRPFMLQSKDRFRDYIKDNDLAGYVVEDESNSDETYRRNWVRNTLVKEIDKVYPGLKKVVKKRMTDGYKALKEQLQTVEKTRS